MYFKHGQLLISQIIMVITSAAACVLLELDNSQAGPLYVAKAPTTISSRKVVENIRATDAARAAKNATAASEKLRADADNSRAVADKSRIEADNAQQNMAVAYAKARADADNARVFANVAWLNQISNVVSSAATSLLTLLATFIAILAVPRILSTVTDGALTISIPFLGAISLPQRTAADQQKRGSPPSVTPEPIESTPSRKQLAAANELKMHFSEKSSADAVLSAQSGPSLVQLALDSAGLSISSDVYFRTFFRNLFLSQYKLLVELASNGPIGIAEAKQRYATASGLGVKPLTFREWLNYLIKYGMIARVGVDSSAGRLEASERGKNFILWSNVTNHGESQIRAAGLGD